MRIVNPCPNGCQPPNASETITYRADCHIRHQWVIETEKVPTGPFDVAVLYVPGESRWVDQANLR